MKVYFDTTVLVAASIKDHSHHAQAIALLRAAKAKKIQAYVSAHGLAELYAVLTRAPFAPPVYPNEAWQVINDNVLPWCSIVVLSGKEYEETIRKCAQQGWGGGRIYDALHLRCAEKTGTEKIYTFNIRHFQQLAPELTDRITAP